MTSMVQQRILRCVHVFGGTSSPSCCNYALKRMAYDNRSRYQTDVMDTLNRNFYVDDLLKKWREPQRNFSVGDVVILQDELHRNKWRLAKIIDVYKDKNGNVQSVQLHIGNSESNTLVSRVLVRPISKMILLVETNKEVRSPTGEPQ